MNRKHTSALGLFAISALLAACGCAGPVRSGGATTRPAAAHTAAEQAANDAWPALPMPADFDRRKAELTLADVPGDPPAPAAAGGIADAELPRQALQHIAEARRLFSEQRYSETIRELERALRYNPDSHEAHRMMAVAGLRSGDDERARTAADKALAIKPNDLGAHYVRARVHEKAGRKDEALTEYRLALKSDPADANSPYRWLTAYYLSNLLFDQGYYAAGIEQAHAFEAGLNALGDKAGEDPELAALARTHRQTSIIRTARAYGLLGDNARAAATLRLAVGQSPQDAALRSEYIHMLGRAKRLDEAAREAATFATDTNGDKAAIELLVVACRRAGQPERALDLIRRLATAQPDNIELWKLYIDALSAARKYDEVVAALNDLVARHPDAIDSRWRLIQLTRERGDWSAWLHALVQHLRSQPQEYARVMEEFARLPQETAVYMAAEVDQPAEQRKLLPAKPVDDQAASAMDVLLARLSARLDRDEQARAMLAQALRRTPGFAPAVIGAAELHVAACRWKEAIDLITGQASALGAPSARLEHLLAQSYDGLDEIDKALEHYQQALKLDQDAVDTMLLLGRLYERGRRGKEATALYQKAIAADPDNMRARELLVRNLLTQAAQDGRPNGRLVGEIKDMQRRAPQDPATIRAVALADLVAQGAEGRKACLETLRNLAQNHPNEARGREDLIAILLSMREYAEARAQAQALVRLQPYSADAGELAGVAELRMLDLPAAAAQLDRALEFYPNRESLLARRAQVALVMQDYATAIRCYAHLLELKYASGQRENYREALVDTYSEAGRLDEGRKTVETWLARAEDDAERQALRRYLLILDATAGDVDRYVARVREWLKSAPEDDYLRGLLIGSDWGTAKPMGLIGQKRFDEAVLLSLRWLEEGLQAKREKRIDRLRDLRLVSRILTALQAAGRHDEAIELARGQVAAYADAQEHGTALYLLRVTYLRAGKIDEAITVTQEMAGGEQPQETMGDERILVTLLSRAGRHEEAVAQVKKQLAAVEDQRSRIEAFAENNQEPRQRLAIQRAFDELREQKAMLLRLLSYAHQRMGQDDVAKTRLREAYQLDPTDVGTNNDLGYILADTGEDLVEAERMVHIALAEQPRQAAYQDSFAWVLYKKGDFEGAKTWLLRATAMEEGQDPVVYDHLADVQWRLGEKEAAVKNWHRSLEAHAAQLRMGEAEMERDIVDRVKAKLSAVETGRQPQLAPTAAESRPAP